MTATYSALFRPILHAAAGIIAVAALTGILWVGDGIGGLRLLSCSELLLLLIVAAEAALASLPAVGITVIAAIGAAWLLDSRRAAAYGTSQEVLHCAVSTLTIPAIAGFILLLRHKLTTHGPRQERDLFRAVIAAMHDAIVETDWKGIRDVNPSFCKMTGFARDELVGTKPPYPFWPEEQYAAIAAALETSMRGRALDFELVMTRKNGERFPVLLSVSSILDGSSKSRILYSFREITEIKRAQQTLRESQRIMKCLFDSNLIGIALCNELAVVESNDVMLNMVGYSREDLLAGLLKRAILTTPESKVYQEERIRQMSGGAVAAPLELELVRKDGSRFPVLAGATPVQQDPLQFIVFCVDLTAQKQQARELANAKETAETAHRTLHALLTRLSRELRNPLTPIREMAEMLHKDQRLVPEIRDQLDTIRRHADTAHGLIDEMATPVDPRL